MRVQQCYHAQKSHEQLAVWVNEQFAVWNGRKISNITSTLIDVGMTGVKTRVMAAVYGALWAVTEACTIFPRFIALALEVSSSENSYVSAAKKIAVTYKMSVRTAVFQGASFIAAMTLPELFYGRFDGHKTFFLHHVNVFIETMPDLPEIYEAVYAAYGINCFDSLSQVWLDLGFTGKQWKRDLKNEFVRKFESDPQGASELLHFEKPALIKCLYAVFFSRIVQKLDELAENNRLTLASIVRLDCKTLVWMYTQLKTNTLKKIFELRPDLESNLENNIDQAGALFELLTEFRFRSPQSVTLGKIFLEKMIQVRNELLKDGVFTVEDLEGYDDVSMSSILCHAIIRFVSTAKVTNDTPSHLIFRAEDKTTVVIKDDRQFFKSRERLIALRAAYIALTPGQKEALLERLSWNDEAVKAKKGKLSDNIRDKEVRACFQLVVGLRHDLIEKPLMSNDKLREEDQTCWHDAFLAPDADG